jgi:putative phage-type endonuclease
MPYLRKLKRNLVGFNGSWRAFFSMSFYLVEDLEQGTAEWRQWRKGVIGASDAPVIMGENPWGSPARLLREKLGLVKEFTGNAATREGHRLEEPARELLAKNYSLNLKPTIVQDSKEPYLAASLDAISSDGRQVFEIKSGVKSYEYVESNGYPPDYYRAQLQHILMITELEWIVYAAFRPDKPIITLNIHRNDDYIKQLRKNENDFVKQLVERNHRMQYQFVGRLAN